MIYLSCLPNRPTAVRLLFLLLVSLPAPLWAQSFTSSNLPIVVIETQGQSIVDEPKVIVRMRIIDNGEGVRNRLTDPATDYDGWAGIEIRGASSQSFPKKQYGFETRDADGEGRDVSLLGFPEEEDWILHAPYSDKSLMRNVLTYRLARSMGRYASRTRYCEVVLDGQYQGVYVLMEKIKRDKNQVDVNNLKEDETSGDDLTGGYVVQIDRREDGWASSFAGAHSRFHPYYQFNEPGVDDIVPEQQAYIRQFLFDFESTMASDGFEDEVAGYPSLIDEGSFVDLFLLNELGANVDGYRLSSYLHKEKDSIDSLLHAGPVWDFNLAFGNADYYDGAATSGFRYEADLRGDSYPVPFWWTRLAESERFADKTALRWAELRTGPMHEDSLMAAIDATAALLDESQARNFIRWPVLGRYVWPNAYVGDTYAQEVDYLKRWLRERLAWMDAELNSSPVAQDAPLPASGFALSPPSPTPSRTRAAFTLRLDAAQHVAAALFDARGRHVATVHDGTLGPGEHPFGINVAALSAGVYLIRVQGDFGVASTRLIAIGR